MSVISAAFAVWREAREAYDSALLAAYVRAEEATNGALLNARGREKGIDPISLFMGNAVRAYAYASPELVEHWEKYPRMPFVVFEAQWVAAQEQAA